VERQREEREEEEEAGREPGVLRGLGCPGFERGGGVSGGPQGGAHRSALRPRNQPASLQASELPAKAGNCTRPDDPAAAGLRSDPSGGRKDFASMAGTPTPLPAAARARHPCAEWVLPVVLAAWFVWIGTRSTTSQHSALALAAIGLLYSLLAL